MWCADVHFIHALFASARISLLGTLLQSMCCDRKQMTLAFADHVNVIHSATLSNTEMHTSHLDDCCTNGYDATDCYENAGAINAISDYEQNTAVFDTHVAALRNIVVASKEPLEGN